MSIEAMRKALNYIENTEGELGIKLSCGDALREALAAQPPAAPVNPVCDLQALLDIRDFLADIVGGAEVTERSRDTATGFVSIMDVQFGKQWADGGDVSFQRIHGAPPQSCSAATDGAEEAIRDWWYSDRRQPMTSKEAAKSLIWYLAKCGMKIVRDEPQGAVKPVAWMNREHIGAYMAGTPRGIAWASPEQTDFYDVALYASQPPAAPVETRTGPADYADAGPGSVRTDQCADLNAPATSLSHSSADNGEQED